MEVDSETAPEAASSTRSLFAGATAFATANNEGKMLVAILHRPSTALPPGDTLMRKVRGPDLVRGGGSLEMKAMLRIKEDKR